MKCLTKGQSMRVLNMIWIGFLLLIAGCQTGKMKNTLNLNEKDSHKILEFIPHSSNKPFGNYVTLDLQYSAYEKLKNDLEMTLGTHLKTRGEAHITVITPVEYDQQLKSHVGMDELNAFVSKEVIKAQFQTECVGIGSIKKDKETLKTYYVVVSSNDLLAIREKVKEKYPKSSFNPSLFYPHITLGFTERDLHYEEGVVKDLKSCEFTLKKD